MNTQNQILPNEIWLEIFSHIMSEAPYIARTCKLFNSLLDDGFWKKRIEKDFSDVEKDKVNSFFETHQSYKSVYKALYLDRKFGAKTFIAFTVEIQSPEITSMQNLLNNQKEEYVIGLSGSIKIRKMYSSKEAAVFAERSIYGTNKDAVIFGFNLSQQEIEDYKKGTKFIPNNFVQHVVEISFKGRQENEFHSYRVNDGNIIANDVSEEFKKGMK